MKIYVKSVTKTGIHLPDGTPIFKGYHKSTKNTYRLSDKECKAMASFPEWVQEKAIEFNIRPGRGGSRYYWLDLGDKQLYAFSINALRKQIDEYAKENNL